MTLTTETPSRELIALRAIRTAKAGFERALIGHAASHVDPDHKDTATIPSEDLRALKSAGVSQIAELLYLIEAVEAHRPDRLRRWLEGHNASISKKLSKMEADGKNYTESGLSRQRIESGFLSDNQINGLVDEAELGVLRFDQSSLACLLIEGMSVESCRTLILLLDKYGFVKRLGSNNVRIHSRGVLEKLYKEHLMNMLDELSVERPAA